MKAAGFKGGKPLREMAEEEALDWALAYARLYW